MQKIGICVYVDKAEKDWLDAKTVRGAKLSSFMRYLLKTEMQKEQGMVG